MLDERGLEAIFDQIGVPSLGRALVRKARKEAPVREVRARGGNVLTFYQSMKMGRTVGTESRHLEFAAAVGHEFDAEVIEYFPQPCQLRFEVIDDDGEVHKIDHTPDFLVVTETGIWLEEWKSHERMESLARKLPWRYRRESEEQWNAPLIADWLGKRGIGYRIRTERNIPARRIENLLMLEDYLLPEAPACSDEVASAVKNALVEEGAMTLADLFERAPCSAEEAFKLIADGLLVADLDNLPLEDSRSFRVYRSIAVREFERAALTSASDNVLPFDGVVSIEPNAKVSYEGNPYTVSFVGIENAVLSSPEGNTVQISLSALTDLARDGSLVMLDPGSIRNDPMAGIADLSDKQLEVALKRKRALDTASHTPRTGQRLRAAVDHAKNAGINELKALAPRYNERGNRESRLTPEQEAAMTEVINNEYLKSNAPSVSNCHIRLVALCKERSIKAPSRPTLAKRIKALNQKSTDMARFGKRVAYQNSDFVHTLDANTPIHGSRAFQYVHMDHTLLDVSLQDRETGRSLGRPWLSLAVCAYSRRELGRYLSFDPPSYRSNMMLLRDIVRRHQRLPQFIVVDNGADFRSRDFTSFCEIAGVHIRYRPAAHARHGAVLERLFGTIHSTYIHNLAGNTKVLKNVRQATKRFLPSNLEEWSLTELYWGLDEWATGFYDTQPHSALGISPKEAFERSIAATGAREHRIFTLSRDFLILTCPSVDRGGMRTVDPQRGVKLNSNYWYWCPELRDPRFAHKKVPVRYDPWDASIAYVCLKDRWVAARCRALSKLNVMTVKERELYTAEMRRRNLLAPGEEANSQKLLEFSRAFTPEGVTEKHLLQQKANRQLYGELNLGVEPDGESTAPTSTFRFRSITDELTADNDELDIEIPDGEPWDLDETDLPTYERF